MGKAKRILSIFFVGALAASAAAANFGANAADRGSNAAREGDQASARAGHHANQAVDRIIAREHDEIATIRRYNPIIETYIQDMKPDKDMGAMPVRDHYFLGQADLSKGVVDNSMLGNKKGQAR